MDTQKQQVIDRLKQATNILVTVSSNPSVDQLSAAIGITLLLNKLGKHATAVYSGKTPSTIEFLQPEKTLEKNTDSLRDFIIALDKAKADKLRYKVEDQMVKIFITPYRTSISDKDLEFSQGDFNVEVVLALGVARQQDLDQAITAHGRILHDATVIGIATQVEEEALGSMNWVDPDTSSLSEMMADLGLTLDPEVLDSQSANALLTGIVAETERFSNQKTSANTMQSSARLIAAGANQQLVASELATPEVLGAQVSDSGEGDGQSDSDEAKTAADGSLVIEHLPGEEPAEKPISDDEVMELPEPEEEPEVDQIQIDYDGQLILDGEPAAAPGTETPDAEVPAPEAGDSQTSPESPQDDQPELNGGSRLIMQPPTMGGQLTANSEPEGLDPAIDPLAPHNASPLLHRDSQATTPTEPEQPKQQEVTPIVSPLPSEPLPPEPDQPNDTLADLERFIASPHAPSSGSPTPSSPEPATAVPAPELTPAAAPEPVVPLEPAAPEVSTPAVDQPETDVNSARDAVVQAMSTQPTLEPVQSLNAMPVDLNLGDIPAVNTSPASAFVDPSANVPPEPAINNISDAHVASDPGLPPGLITNEPVDNTAADTTSPTAPPPVPPPMMPPNLGQPPSN